MPKLTSCHTSAGLVEYSDRGEGPSILFFHGGQGSALDDTLDDVFEPSRFRLLIPSRPGYRGTPLAGKTTPRDAATLGAALLDELGIETTIVVGVSLGGRAAIEFAATFPDRTRALVLGSAISGPWHQPGDPLYEQSKRMFSPRFERLVWGLIRVSFQLFPRQMAGMFLGQLSTVSPESLDRDAFENVRRSMRNLRSYEGFVTDLDQSLTPDALSKVRCPTLIQHSRNDGSVPLEHALRSERQITGAALRLYDNALGHFLWTGPGSKQAVEDLREFALSQSVSLAQG